MVVTKREHCRTIKGTTLTLVLKTVTYVLQDVPKEIQKLRSMYPTNQPISRPQSYYFKLMVNKHLVLPFPLYTNRYPSLFHLTYDLDFLNMTQICVAYYWVTDHCFPGEDDRLIQ